MIIAPSAPATERNREPILDVLRQELTGNEKILEIGSGTGQHAVYIGGEIQGLTWQTSDVTDNHPGINAWRASSAASNVLAPLELDVAKWTPDGETFDVVFSANTAHIMSIDEVELMFAIAGEVLLADGCFLLYGPFNRNGRFNSDSNEQFHRSLRSQKATMGIRDLEDLDTFAEQSGMRRQRLYAMPTNNLLVVWRMQSCAEVDSGDSRAG